MGLAVMQDRPTAPELLDAMAAQLFGEVREWVPRERRFQILVLANLCAVLGRELRAGEAPSQADLEAFQSLLGGPPDEPSDLDAAVRLSAAELSSRIRSGELDGELGLVIEELRSHVARKLDIARPGYAEASG
ncbi:DUF6285 domain-containing protein [soil metagenome]